MFKKNKFQNRNFTKTDYSLSTQLQRWGISGNFWISAICLGQWQFWIFYVNSNDQSFFMEST